MAFDATRHTIDDKGFIIDPDTKGHLGQLAKPIVKHDDDGSDYPKWVALDPTQVVEVNGNKVAPLWPGFFIDRVTHEVSVLVHDEVEEQKASVGKQEEINE